MSLKQFEFIEPQDFINLKNQVQAEVKRRNYKDLDKLYNLYATSSYNFNPMVKQNKEITYEDIEIILKPLRTINSSTLGVNIKKQNTNITTVEFNKIKNALNIFSKGERRANNTCSTSCIGMCIGCTDSCTSCTGCSSCSGCSGCGGCGGCGGCDGSCTLTCGGGSTHAMVNQNWKPSSI